MKQVKAMVVLLLICFSASSLAATKIFKIKIEYLMSANIKVIDLKNLDGGPIVCSPDHFKMSGKKGEISTTCTAKAFNKQDFLFVSVYYVGAPYKAYNAKLSLKGLRTNKVNQCYLYGTRGNETVRCD